MIMHAHASSINSGQGGELPTQRCPRPQPPNVLVGDLMLERSYDGVSAYRRVKLAQIMLTFDLAGEPRALGMP